MAAALRETRAFLESATGKKAAKGDSARAQAAADGASVGGGGGSSSSSSTGGSGGGGADDALAQAAASGDATALARAEALALLAAPGERPLTYDVFSVRARGQSGWLAGWLAGSCRLSYVPTPSLVTCFLPHG